MRIWIMDIDFGKNEENCTYELEAEKNSLKLFQKELDDGKPHIQKPKDLCLKLVDGTVPCDCSDLCVPSGVLLFSEQAKESLKELLRDCVEFIPIKYEDQLYYIVHSLHFLDAIDYEHAEKAWFGFKKYAFFPEQIENVNLFKLLLNGHKIPVDNFVTDAVRDKVIQDGLTGFKFTLVWDSENMRKIDAAKKKIDESACVNAPVLSLDCNSLGNAATLVLETAKGKIVYSFTGCDTVEAQHRGGFDRYFPFEVPKDTPIPYLLESIELDEISGLMEFKILMDSLYLHILCRDFDVIYGNT